MSSNCPDLTARNRPATIPASSSSAKKKPPYYKNGRVFTGFWFLVFGFWFLVFKNLVVSTEH
jgi:hypothetical protein